MLSRAHALCALEELMADAVRRLSDGDSGAVDLAQLDRSAHGANLEPVINDYTAAQHPHRVAQLWVVMAAIHANLVAGKKLAQRELWYRLKPLGLFESPALLYERILEVCAIVSAWCGAACPRESLGVVASARGSMTGTLTLNQPEGPRQLDGVVFAIPGDPAECLALRFTESRARYIVVVEKDTVFSRLVEDGFLRHVPCLLITACGFPSLAARALVQHAVEVLALPVLVLTDYNPHGMALMLTYKHGSTTFALDGYCCPHVVWAGLHTADVLRLEGQSTAPPSASARAPASRPAVTLASSNFQPFTERDHSVMEGLLRRSVVAGDDTLRLEALAMQAQGRKIELEALHSLGPDTLTLFLRDKILTHA